MTNTVEYFNFCGVFDHATRMIWNLSLDKCQVNRISPKLSFSMDLDVITNKDRRYDVRPFEACRVFTNIKLPYCYNNFNLIPSLRFFFRRSISAIS